MRLRHVGSSHDMMREHPLVIKELAEYEKDITRIFGNDKPVHVEFGSGYGGYFSSMAKKHKENNYLAFEWNSKVIVRGMKLLDDEIEKLDNFRFVHSDAGKAIDLFEQHSLDRIYLNFSDPWPKKKHAKRRLTYHTFLRKYEKLLKEGGELHFKTDNDDLFQFSLEELQYNGWNMKLVTRDLHSSEFSKDNIMTEYEKKFSEKGKNINKLIATK